MRVTSTARVATGRAAIYLEQLCDHFADPSRRHSPQEFEVAVAANEGMIDFAPVISGRCRLDARHEGVLVVEASANDEAGLERVQRIVTKHLERFGQPHGLTVEWSAARLP